MVSGYEQVLLLQRTQILFPTLTPGSTQRGSSQLPVPPRQSNSWPLWAPALMCKYPQPHNTYKSISKSNRIESAKTKTKKYIEQQIKNCNLQGT